MKEVYPVHPYRKEYPLVPLRDIIVFPNMVVPLFVGREKSIKALEYAMGKDKMLLLSAQKNANIDNPSENDIYRVGTLSTIVQLLKLPDGTIKLLVEGKKRGVITKYIPSKEFFLVEVEEISDIQENTVEIEALMRSVNSVFETFAKLNPRVPPEMIMSVASITDPHRLVDTISVHLNLRIEEKQKLLEIRKPKDRLEKLYSHLQSEIGILQVEKKIRSRVKKQMEKTQKEYYLNEQMRAIQKELGQKDEFSTEMKELEMRIKRKRMSAEAKKKVLNEFKKLKMMPAMSAEASVIRNYIDWLLSLPWYHVTKDKLNIDEAEKILEEDHYGLKKPKQRILEYLAVQGLVKRMKGPILCFVGPPGVGKTSLGRSIARATNRNFIRLSLGGVRDEAEIRGHRRTYVGALPGKIIQSIKKAGSNNPVFLLDEVDKMSTDFRGDPSAALLEVLDPEQNNTFNDHYLDVDYDLSQVMFITTANNLYAIPPALRDRMEIIHLPGYTEWEKLAIAKQFLVKKQREANGLTEKNISFSDNAIRRIIREYTREAGVRNLEREIASICRKVAKEVIKNGPETHIKITQTNIPKYLGVPKYRYGKTEEEDKIGIANGLAWTETGGDLLVIEVVVLPGKGKLIVTGKLGEVMQESAQAALSYVRSKSEILNIDKDLFQDTDIHIHVPEGAIPKDGPSAGITMATAIASALTKYPVKSSIAMTGEITLRGRVLPVGGLKEKILAAHRAGIKAVIMPDENLKDLKEDVPKKVLDSIEIIPVNHMDEVLKKSLVVEDLKNFLKPSLKEEKEKVYYPQIDAHQNKIAH